MPRTIEAAAVAAGERWGPHMQGLDPAGRRFVVELFLARGNVTAAFKASGLGADMSSTALRTAAHRLVHSEPVRAAVIEWARASIEIAAPLMISKMIALATGAKSEGEQRKAAADLLNRASLAAPVQVHVEHEHVMSYDEKVVELQRLARLFGDDPMKGLVPPPGPAITDAEIVDYGPDLANMTIKVGGPSP